MKTLLALLLAAFTFVATAQPQKIHYQAVAVAANGKPIKNSTVGLRLSVLESLPTGSVLYTETQTASTDASGQFSLFLGGGSTSAGTFAAIPWANGNDKFLKVEMDAQGGSNYQTMGTTQLVSVPYAMVAGAVQGSNGQMYQLTIGANAPTWTCPPPRINFQCRGQPTQCLCKFYQPIRQYPQQWNSKLEHYFRNRRKFKYIEFNVYHVHRGSWEFLFTSVSNFQCLR